MSVRAKMRVGSMTPYEGEGGGGTVNLVPVAGGSPENDEFYRWTPGGSVQLGTVNQLAYDQFAIGREFYVDFTPAG